MRNITKVFSLLRFKLLCMSLFVGFLLPSTSYAVGFGNFIVGGQVVGSAAKYPFMASVQLDKFSSGQYTHTCGGTLIAELWVVTAAHCVISTDFGVTYSPSRIGLVLGKSNLAAPGGTFILAEQIIPHPDYNPNFVRNDIALIKLSSPYIAPVAVLPAEDSPGPVVDESSIVTGWGSLTETGVSSNQLREVALPVISNAACFPFYPELFDSRTAVCAGGSRLGGQDSCKGDSGGPLLVGRNNVNVIAGVISFGDGCARPGVPGVYTRVESFVDWITSITTGTLEYGEELKGEPVDNTAITRLSVNTSSAGNVLAGNVAYYDVSGARQVNLTSTTGDADLYMIDDASFQAISSELLKCVSRTANQLDICNVDQSADGAYAVVFGYTDSDYTISTQSLVTNTNTVQPFGNGADTISASSSSGGVVSLWMLFLVSLLRFARRPSASRSTDI